MNEVKVFVRENERANIVCPQCGKSTSVMAGKFRNTRKTVNVKCVCQHVFTVFFEFRKSYRKNVTLNGRYRYHGSSKSFRSMTVKNISHTGIGFIAPDRHDIHIGDTLEIQFTLDDFARSEIEKVAVVRAVKNNYIGSEFKYPNEMVASLGFYLMP